MTAAAVMLCMLYSANKGVDVVDSGYLLSQYKSIAEGYGEPVFGTLLSSCVGALISLLFPSHALIAHRVLVAVSYTAVGVMGYFTVRRRLPMPLALAASFSGVFFGRMLSFVVGYNSLSALLCTACAVLILLALEKDSRAALVCAGLLLAAAVGARLPNVLMTAFAAAVAWYYGFRDGRRKAMRRTGLFLLSVGAPFAAGFAALVIFGGADGTGAFLSQMSAYIGRALGGEDSHSLIHTVRTLVLNNLAGVRNIIILAALPVIVIWLTRSHPMRRHANLLFVLYGAAVAAAGIAVFGIYSGPRSNFYGNTSLTFAMIYAVSALTLALAFACAWIYRRRDPLFAAFGILCAVMTICFPLGTDTGVDSLASMLVLPLCFVCAAAYRIGKERGHPAVCASPLGLCSIMISAGLVFSFTYGYSDRTLQTLDAAVDTAPITSVRTTQEKAAELEYFIELVEPYEQSGRELIVSGGLPLAHALTDMRPFFGSAWQDLESYSLERFETALSETQTLPVIVINLRSTYSTVWPNSHEWDYSANPKHAALLAFMDANSYELTSSDGVLELWLPPDMMKGN